MQTPVLFGDCGRLYIPSAEISVPLYKYVKGESQEIVDNKSSAVYKKDPNGGCDYIADHATQDFCTLKRCTIGCYAYIRTLNDIKTYQCVCV